MPQNKPKSARAAAAGAAAPTPAPAATPAGDEGEALAFARQAIAAAATGNAKACDEALRGCTKALEELRMSNGHAMERAAEAVIDEGLQGVVDACGLSGNFNVWVPLATASSRGRRKIVDAPNVLETLAKALGGSLAAADTGPTLSVPLGIAFHTLSSDPSLQVRMARTPGLVTTLLRSASRLAPPARQANEAVLCTSAAANLLSHPNNRVEMCTDEVVSALVQVLQSTSDQVVRLKATDGLCALWDAPGADKSATLRRHVLTVAQAVLPVLESPPHPAKQSGSNAASLFLHFCVADTPGILRTVAHARLATLLINMFTSAQRDPRSLLLALQAIRALSTASAQFAQTAVEQPVFWRAFGQSGTAHEPKASNALVLVPMVSSLFLGCPKVSHLPGFPHLVQFLLRAAECKWPPEALSGVFTALGNLAWQEANRVSLCRQPGLFPVLVASAMNPAQNLTQEPAVKALFSLSSEASNVPYMLATPGVLEALVVGARSSHVATLDAALSGLRNFVRGDGGGSRVAARKLMKMDGFVELLVRIVRSSVAWGTASKAWNVLEGLASADRAHPAILFNAPGLMGAAVDALNSANLPQFACVFLAMMLYGSGTQPDEDIAKRMYHVPEMVPAVVRYYQRNMLGALTLLRGLATPPENQLGLFSATGDALAAQCVAAERSGNVVSMVALVSVISKLAQHADVKVQLARNVTLIDALVKGLSTPESGTLMRVSCLEVLTELAILDASASTLARRDGVVAALSKPFVGDDASDASRVVTLLNVAREMRVDNGLPKPTPDLLAKTAVYLRLVMRSAPNRLQNALGWVSDALNQAHEEAPRIGRSIAPRLADELIATSLTCTLVMGDAALVWESLRMLEALHGEVSATAPSVVSVSSLLATVGTVARAHHHRASSPLPTPPTPPSRSPGTVSWADVSAKASSLARLVGGS